MKNSLPYSLAFIWLLCGFSVIGCSPDTTSVNGGKTAGAASYDTSIVWTDWNGAILHDYTPAFQPRDNDSESTVAFRPFFPNPVHGSGTFIFAVPERMFVKVV